ncbi:MAG: hypothetical protein H7318_09245 [Oligoflexus sp.]|nr:hypothetical protein [Oligoflexus sp.]
MISINIPTVIVVPMIHVDPRKFISFLFERISDRYIRIEMGDDLTFKHPVDKKMIGLHFSRLPPAEPHVHWVYSAYILMSMMKIEGGLRARKNAVSKVIRMNPSQVLGRKIQTLQGQFGGREKIRELVAAVVQGKAAA